MRLQFDPQVFKDTYVQFNEDKVPRLAAALSYTTIFRDRAAIHRRHRDRWRDDVSLHASGSGHGHTAVENNLIASVQHAAGPASGPDRARPRVGELRASRPVDRRTDRRLGDARRRCRRAFCSAARCAQHDLARPAAQAKNLWAAVRDRVASFGMLLAIGFVLLVSTALNAAIAVIVAAHFVALLPFPGAALVFTVGELDPVDRGDRAALRADVQVSCRTRSIAWRDVWTGAICSPSVLFVVGQSLIALYLGRAGTASAYGAAGSLLIVLLWLYYSSMILLVGAEFTRAFAQRHGSHIASIAPASAVVCRRCRSGGLARLATNSQRNGRGVAYEPRLGPLFERLYASKDSTKSR